MQPFERNGKQVEFRAVTGVAVAPGKHVETYTSGSGGGGTTFNGHGYTAPVNISTTVVIQQDFFVREESGRETPVQLRNENIPLAEGQRVTMISGHVGDTGKWTHLVNHNAERYWTLSNAFDLAVAWGLVRKPIYTLFIGVTIGVVTGNVLNGSIGFLAAVAYWVYEGIKIMKVAKALDGHLNGIGSDTLKAARPMETVGAMA